MGPLSHLLRREVNSTDKTTIFEGKLRPLRTSWPLYHFEEDIIKKTILTTMIHDALQSLVIGSIFNSFTPLFKTTSYCVTLRLNFGFSFAGFVVSFSKSASFIFFHLNVWLKSEKEGAIAVKQNYSLKETKKVCEKLRRNKKKFH